MKPAIIQSVVKAEKGWRTVHLCTEGEPQAKFRQIVMWAFVGDAAAAAGYVHCVQFDEPRDPIYVEMRGVQPLVAPELPVSYGEGLVFATLLSDYLGIAEPGDDERSWDAVAKEKYEADIDEDERASRARAREKPAVR